MILFRVFLLVAITSFAYSMPAEPKDETSEAAKKKEGEDGQKEDKKETNHKSFLKEYGDKDKKFREKGYNRKSEDEGDDGYKHFDSFHKKNNDKYGYESHSSYGKVKKGGATGGDADIEYNDKDGHEAAASRRVLHISSPWHDTEILPHFDIEHIASKFHKHGHGEHYIYDHHPGYFDDHDIHYHNKYSDYHLFHDHHHHEDDHHEYDYPSDHEYDHHHHEHHYKHHDHIHDHPPPGYGDEHEDDHHPHEYDHPPQHKDGDSDYDHPPDGHEHDHHHEYDHISENDGQEYDHPPDHHKETHEYDHPPDDEYVPDQSSDQKDKHEYGDSHLEYDHPPPGYEGHEQDNPPSSDDAQTSNNKDGIGEYDHPPFGYNYDHPIDVKDGGSDTSPPNNYERKDTEEPEHYSRNKNVNGNSQGVFDNIFYPNTNQKKIQEDKPNYNPNYLNNVRIYFGGAYTPYLNGKKNESLNSGKDDSQISNIDNFKSVDISSGGALASGENVNKSKSNVIYSEASNGANNHQYIHQDKEFDTHEGHTFSFDEQNNKSNTQANTEIVSGNSYNSQNVNVPDNSLSRQESMSSRNSINTVNYDSKIDSEMYGPTNIDQGTDISDQQNGEINLGSPFNSDNQKTDYNIYANNGEVRDVNVEHNADEIQQNTNIPLSGFFNGSDQNNDFTFHQNSYTDKPKNTDQKINDVPCSGSLNSDDQKVQEDLNNNQAAGKIPNNVNNKQNYDNVDSTLLKQKDQNSQQNFNDNSQEALYSGPFNNIGQKGVQVADTETNTNNQNNDVHFTGSFGSDNQNRNGSAASSSTEYHNNYNYEYGNKNYEKPKNGEEIFFTGTFNSANQGSNHYVESTGDIIQTDSDCQQKIDSHLDTNLALINADSQKNHQSLNSNNAPPTYGVPPDTAHQENGQSLDLGTKDEHQIHETVESGIDEKSNQQTASHLELKDDNSMSHQEHKQLGYHYSKPKQEIHEIYFGRPFSFDMRNVDKRHNFDSTLKSSRDQINLGTHLSNIFSPAAGQQNDHLGHAQDSFKHDLLTDSDQKGSHSESNNNAREYPQEIYFTGSFSSIHNKNNNNHEQNKRIVHTSHKNGPINDGILPIEAYNYINHRYNGNTQDRDDIQTGGLHNSKGDSETEIGTGEHRRNLADNKPSDKSADGEGNQDNEYKTRLSPPEP